MFKFILKGGKLRVFAPFYKIFFSMENISFVNLNANKPVPAFPKLIINRSGGYVSFGQKNQFPQEVIAANSRSPVSTAIIESTTVYICGKGVKNSELDGFVGEPNTGESWDELLEKTAKDYKTFGGFYLQVILNKGGKTVSLFHQDFSTVRIGQIDDKGAPLTFKISNDWTKTSGKNKPIELDAWTGLDKAEKGISYIYHVWDYSAGLVMYCLPNYFAARDYIEADGLLGEFYRNSIDNGFAPSAIVSFPSNPSEEKKKAVESALKSAFCGTRGANSLITAWGESSDLKTTIQNFNASNNADIYNNVEKIVFQKIVSAHRLSSPTLAGVSGSGNLSGNAAEIIDAYVLYNYTVIEKMRNKILDHLNKFTKINGTAKLVIKELDVLPKIRETETSEEVPAQIDDEGSSGAPEPATLQKKSPLKKLLALFNKYIRKEPKPGGGFRYIYKEPKGKAVPSASESAKRRAKYLGEMKPLLKKKVRKDVGGKSITVGFTDRGNKHLYSDTFGRSKNLKKEELKNLDKALAKSQFVKSSPLGKERNDGITEFLYFKDNNKRVFYNVANRPFTKSNGRSYPYYFVYSATDRLKR
jgi:hypothetical protein